MLKLANALPIPVTQDTPSPKVPVLFPKPTSLIVSFYVKNVSIHFTKVLNAVKTHGNKPI